MTINPSRLSWFVFPLAVILMWVPLLMLDQWLDNEKQPYLQVRFASSALLALLVCSYAGLRILTPRGRPSYTAPFLFWLAFSLFSLASTAWSIDPFGTATNAIVFGAFLFGATAAMGDDSELRQGMLWRCSLASLIFFVVAALTMEMRPRTFGFINANWFGHFGLAAIILADMSGRWVRRLTLAGLLVIIYAQSRTILIAWLIYIGMKVMIRLLGNIRHPIVMTIAVIGLAVFAMLAGQLMISVIIQNISQLLGVSDTTRTGADFAGRGLHWAAGLRVLENNELFGFGYATRGGFDETAEGAALNAHSGMINLLLDLGFVGALLFVAAYLSALTALFKRTLLGNRIALCGAAFMVSFLPLMALEPNYLPFGSADLLPLLFSLGIVFRRPRQESISPPKRRRVVWSRAF